MNKYIRDSIPSDVVFLSSRLRKADIAELAAVVGFSPIQALAVGFTNSRPCYTIMSPLSGEPIAMLGVVPDGGSVGLIWMAGTDGIKDCTKSFLQYCKPVLEELLTNYSVLHNHVDASNMMHIRWLKWMGFTFNKQVVGGVANIPLIPFFINKDE